jgi:hypothetical protein
VQIAVVAKKKTAGGLVEKSGPPTAMEQHAKQFRKVHKGEKIIIRKGKLVAFARMPQKEIAAEIGNFILENHKKFNHLQLKKAIAKYAG